jgi:hypothetical protein
LMTKMDTIEDPDGEPGVLNLRVLQRMQVLHSAA